MFRTLRNIFRQLNTVLAGVFIIVTIWLFLLFPRLVNDLASLLGNMGTPLDIVQGIVHAIIAFVVSLIPLYFLIIRPLRREYFASEGQGLIVRQGQGVGYIDTESVRHQIYTAIARVGTVKRTEVSVENSVGKASVFVNVVTENSVNAGKKKAELRREIKKVVEDQLGVQLAAEPTITMKLATIEMGIPQAHGEAALLGFPPPTPAPIPAPVTTPPPSAPPQPARYMLPTVETAPTMPTVPASSESPIVARRQFTPTESPVIPPVAPPAPPVVPLSEADQLSLNSDESAASGNPVTGNPVPPDGGS